MSLGQDLRTFDEDSEQLGKLVPVARRIKDATHSFKVNEQMVKDNEGRDGRRSRVTKLNSGNSPVPEAILKRAGESWRSNISFREHERKCNELAAIFYDLFDKVPTIATCVSSFTDDLNRNQKFSKQISECFHRFLTKHWVGFLDEMEGGIKEMILFDVFLPFFVDDVSFTFSHLKTNTFLLPSNASSNPDKWDIMAVRWAYNVHDLWALVKDAETRKRSTSLGWKPDMIKKAIAQSMKDSTQRDKYQMGEWSSFEQMMTNDDLFHSVVSSKTVHCVHQYIKELNGKIRRVVLYEKSDLAEYLYDRETEITSFRKFLDPIYFDVQSFYQSHRGTGEKIYNHALTMDIINNDIVDSARIDGMYWLKGRGNTKDRKLKYAKFTYVDEEVEVINNTSDRQIQGPLAVSRFINGKLNLNANLPDGAGERESVQPISAQEATINQLRSSGIQRSHIMRFYRSFDRLLEEIFERLLSDDYTEYDEGSEARDKFFKDCADADIPRAALKTELCRISSTRSIGFGSVAGTDLLTTELVAMASAMPNPEKRIEAFHSRIAALSDYPTAQNYFPVGEIELDDPRDNTLISLEISHLRNGEVVAVEATQRHDKHSLAVVSLLTESSEQFAQQPVKLMQIFNVSLSHLASHMDFMDQQKSIYGENLESLRPVFAELVNQFKQIQQQAEEIIAAQQQQRAEQQEALQRAQQNAVDPDVLEVLKKSEVATLDAQLQHQVRLVKAANQHTERLIKQADDRNLKQQESLRETRNATIQPQNPAG